MFVELIKKYDDSSKEELGVDKNIATGEELEKLTRRALYKEEMDLETAQTTTTAKFPNLKKGEYDALEDYKSAGYLRNKLDLDTMSFDDLYNNFKIVEQEVKGTANLSSQNMVFVSSPMQAQVSNDLGLPCTNDVVVFSLKVYPHVNKDIGIIDSRCSRSMTGNEEKLDDFVQVKGGTVTFRGGDGKIIGKGTIRTSKLNFENVYYMEELQNFNLFS
nr:ribonuclease H-like domain-containing protein [Tanacetum cinerariifolium]